MSKSKNSHRNYNTFRFLIKSCDNTENNIVPGTYNAHYYKQFALNDEILLNISLVSFIHITSKSVF